MNFNYQIGQKIVKYEKTLESKLKPKTTGHFEILGVHSIGDVTSVLIPGTTECNNIQYT